MNLIQGSYDYGRGNLSLKALKLFLDFMLDIALDQINYMSEVLRIDLIANRIRNYVIFSQKNIYELCSSELKINEIITTKYSEVYDQ